MKCCIIIALYYYSLSSGTVASVSTSGYDTCYSWKSCFFQILSSWVWLQQDTLVVYLVEVKASCVDNNYSKSIHLQKNIRAIGWEKVANRLKPLLYKIYHKNITILLHESEWIRRQL